MSKFAIIGGGPSAFYTASRLLSNRELSKHSSSGKSPIIHIYDRLWAPHGLVRYGVAPDHPEVKNCTHKFDEIMRNPLVRFFGNVQVGQISSSPVPHALPLSLSHIQRHYSDMIIATGSPMVNIHPALPPSEHVLPSLSVVHWYTQHPAAPEVPPLDKIEHVSIIGQGNVALDIARMLLSDPEVLATYDVPEPVLAVLRRSAVKHVSILGRRGPLQAAFTTKEVRELMNLSDASMVPLDPAVLQPPTGVTLSRQQSRVLDLLKKGSKNAPGTAKKTWSLDFFRSPSSLAPPAENEASHTLTLAHNELDQAGRAAPTGATSSLKTNLVVTALGQASDPNTPFYDGAVRHINADPVGRVLDANGQPWRDVYSTGWAAMGARGVLATTMMHAYGVADLIATLPEDRAGEKFMASDVALDHTVPDPVAEGLKNGLVTTYEDWKLVDAEEVRRGEAKAKERERMDWDQARRFLEHSRTYTS
ncbi:FAD/NAD(P)-binding domain-containing protein [Peniophora sp. CONT]|nr:FAD/NAD(P)-binding domain-containing protein [Peniophora sp. CONT]